MESINELMIIIFILFVLDYITAIIGAIKSGSVSSKVGTKGIYKKLGLIIVLILSIVIDFVGNYAKVNSPNLEMLNIFDFSPATFTTTLWMIGNETISIVENLIKMNVAVPKVLIKIFEKLKLIAGNEEK
jgi:toxin secretion/phage lysis holin